jgi:hypothetical protein
VTLLLKTKPLLLAAHFIFCHPTHVGALPLDPYEVTDRYVGTLSWANEPPKKAAAFLKFSPPLWPLSLFSDEVSIEATIRADSSFTLYFASLSAPNRVLSERYPLQIISEDSDDSSGSLVPLQEKGVDLKAGELGNGWLAIRSGDVFFEGNYEPEWRRCMMPSIRVSSRQLYYWLLLPMLGTTLVGSLCSAVGATIRGGYLARSATRGAFLGFLFLPSLLIILFLVVGPLLLALLIGAEVVFRFIGLS